MKHLLLVAAVTMMSVSAMASKARLTSLGFGTNDYNQFVDTQNVFQNPSHLHMMGEWATFEMGPTTNTSTTLGAEGGFVRSMDDAKYGFYLGRKSTFTTAARAQTGYLGQENPFEIMYAAKSADMNWGASFNYSNSDKKSTEMKQNAMGARFGAYTDKWDAAIILGLGSKATGRTAGVGIDLNSDNDTSDANEVQTANTTDEYTGTAGFRINAGYNYTETLKVFVDTYQDGAEVEYGILDVKQTNSEIAVGVLNTMKADGQTFFYGASYVMNTAKSEVNSTEVKTETTTIPVVIGIEADAASWLVLRASVKQSVLIGTSKSDGDTDTVDTNTKVAAGAGVKFNKFTMDGTLTSATDGKFLDNNTSDSLLANLSLTYNF